MKKWESEDLESKTGTWYMRRISFINCGGIPHCVSLYTTCMSVCFSLCNCTSVYRRAPCLMKCPFIIERFYRCHFLTFSLASYNELDICLMPSLTSVSCPQLI